MAKQTINIGTAPNDGTGTPLRTAFDYCNLNFTELYTAVGPSGNNIVVPGSATISGDLTVDTSTLKVDSTNDRVGFGTASPAQGVHLSKSSTSTALTSPPVGGASFRIQNTSSTNNNFGSVEFYNAAGLFGASVNCQYTNQATPTSDLVFVTRGSSGGLEHYRIAADGVATWSEVGGVAGTAMTLNSTGLGIGVSPSNNLHVQGASGATAIRISAVTDGTLGFIGSASGLISGSPANNLAVRAENGLYLSGGGNATQFILNSSGNVGVGVTPSAWNSGYKAIEFGSGNALMSSSSGYGQAFYLNNAVYNTSGNYVYKNTQAAGMYQQNQGAHQWYTAPSGTAGNAITFTQAMTLDASGNLLVGTTSALIASSRRLSVVGTVAAALQSTGAATVEAVNVWHTATTGNNIFIDFDTEASVTSRGSISYNRSGGLVAYNTTSDYRAKDIIGPVSNSGSVIDSLKVYIGKMKGASVERPMLVAHEAQTVAPYAVTGEKDAVDVDGNPRYQQMDVSSFVPLLIAEIQSLRARVQTLEAR
jgi:hypothetical protein